jgi:aryl-alcohol dehydrogenase-like predicted oxidoreductase
LFPQYFKIRISVFKFPSNRLSDKSIKLIVAFTSEAIMEYTNLGKTGLKVSRLCLGTMNFGPQTDEETSHKIMDRALDFGINFFDTANVYGWEMGEGITEQIIGRWLAKSGRRNEIVLASKVYGRMGEGQNDRRLSAKHIRLACEDSLRRLQTDYLDLYQMHHVDRETPWEEIWQAMEQLVAQGKVIYVGSSNFAGLNIAQAQSAAEERHFLGLVSEQSLYNLVDRMIELELIPTCREFGLGLIPYSPLAGGLLGGELKKESKGRRSSDHIKKSIKEYSEQLGTYEAFCRDLGEEPANVALAWLLTNPTVTGPIIGPRTIEQLEASIKSLEIDFSDEQLVKLTNIWPGPGGEAPEAYAW